MGVLGTHMLIEGLKPSGAPSAAAATVYGVFTQAQEAAGANGVGAVVLA